MSGQTIRGTVEAGKELTLPLAKVHLATGWHTMAITPVRIVGAVLMRLRTVILTLVGQ